MWRKEITSGRRMMMMREMRRGRERGKQPSIPYASKYPSAHFLWHLTASLEGSVCVFVYVLDISPALSIFMWWLPL
jgi:hypothetical protein